MFENIGKSKIINCTKSCKIVLIIVTKRAVVNCLSIQKPKEEIVCSRDGYACLLLHNKLNLSAIFDTVDVKSPLHFSTMNDIGI